MRSPASFGRPVRILAGATGLLVITLLAMSTLIAVNLREDALMSAEKDLKRHSLTLAGQAERSFQSVYLILSNVSDHMENQGVFDGPSYEAAMGNQETHKYLKEKLAGLPQLEAITMIGADGKLINFSRYWPIPDVNISDRDYFKVLRNSPDQLTFVGSPVENRGTGTWDIFIARRVNGLHGEFSGLILAAMSLDYFEDFYKSISLGEGSAESLLRDDGTLLARYPRTSEIGKVVAIGGSSGLLQSGGGTIREKSPVDGLMRIKAIRKLSGVPLSILTTQTEGSVLRRWRSTVGLLLGFTGSMALVLIFAATVILRKWKQQELLAKAQSEKIEAEKAKALAETELLRQQERTAEAANKAKSNFLATMSHEIRTPMNAVLGLTSSLLETNLSRDQRESVHAIHVAGDNLLGILNDILDFSKLEAGNLTLESLPFSPASLVGSTLSVVGASAAAKGLEVRVETAPDLPQGLLGDGGRIRQVLLNLASNAIKFTPAGEIAIKVSCISQSGISARVCWSVSDTGLGIAEDRVGALFKDFVQADSSVSRKFGGSGLGLAICRRLLEQMGGEIHVESQLGTGSRFYFELTLPIAKLAPAALQEDDTSAVLLKQRIADSGRPLRVLVVDDNQTNRFVASKMFSGFDVAFVEAENGAEAIAAVANNSFDVVFMDMHMPEMDGLSATRAIRALGKKTAHLPIIAFTANAFADDREACARAGMNDFVAKPVRKKFLLQATLRALWENDAAVLRGDVSSDDADSKGASPLLPTASDDIESFDRATFDTLVTELDMEGATETLGIFVEDTRHRLEEFSKLAVGENRKHVKLQAHSLKSTAATFGFQRLAGLAKQIEAEAPYISEADFKSVVHQMDDAFRTGMTLFREAFEAA